MLGLALLPSRGGPWRYPFPRCRPQSWHHQWNKVNSSKESPVTPGTLLLQKQLRRGGDQARMNPTGLETRPGPLCSLATRKKWPSLSQVRRGSPGVQGARKWLPLEMTPPQWVFPAPPLPWPVAATHRCAHCSRLRGSLKFQVWGHCPQVLTCGQWHMDACAILCSQREVSPRCKEDRTGGLATRPPGTRG